MQKRLLADVLFLPFPQNLPLQLMVSGNRDTTDHRVTDPASLPVKSTCIG
ncbi:hypothetical protein M0L20_24375 [Spirosoma sp. RP8]|uniref:Uncharacterized protein n=1 Tax=Spirosoma liriopis TaxID=2937440 RepID=A0ABT0HS73_9BACT|nr:hypothetical protein [Spirosoma liriopis]MCK8495030.1 hypothetical protein [Spirosoma liriopis]